LRRQRKSSSKRLPTRNRFGWAATFAAICGALSFSPRVGSSADSADTTLKIEAHGEEIAIIRPPGWSVAAKQFANQHKLVNASGTASIKITTESGKDHGEALRRLKEIGTGIGAPPSAYMAIGGWAGLQYRRLEERPQPNNGPQFEDGTVLRVTTVVAVDKLLVRVEAALPSNADQTLINHAETVGRRLAFRSKGDAKQLEKDLEDARRKGAPESRLTNPPGPEAGAAAPATAASFPVVSTPDSPSPAPGAGSSPAGSSQRIISNRNGELEIAVSPDGQTVVVGQQSVFRTSQDGGQTFTSAGSIAFSGGDPSLAYGRSGNFYYAGIRGGCQPADAAGPFGYTCTGMARSADNGQTFPIIANAVVCPNNDPGAPPNLAGFCFPDQEHIAADRFNAGAGGDQVYSTWRNFDATDQDPGLVCSQDGGVTWSAPITVGSGAFPRITVGQNGFVYVAYTDGGNYMLRKYSSCASGLVPLGVSVVVAPRIPVACPFPGHDRCDQNPSSQTVAVDDTNPNHIYYVFAENTGPNNEDIIVRDSLDGGATWPAARVVRVNSLIPGKRIMPWAATTAGELFVTWYDRRNATPCAVPPCPARNDLTEYWGGRARLDGLGNLVAGADFKISDVADGWCGDGTAASWPCGTRGAPGASESCSSQPQLAGSCSIGGAACDFSDGCPAGQGVCQGGNGCPKYGDYNGNAAVAGRLFAGWASASAPAGVTPSGGIDIYFSAKLLGNVGQIQIPGDVVFSDTCVGSSSFATLYVCNTGKGDLEVGPITSTNSEFAVVRPSSGYPVIISPDFCFPFRVRFTPTSVGDKETTFIVPSNDPTGPTNFVGGFGKGVGPTITTFIADAGNFGDVCLGSFKDLNLTINNAGGCPLVISGIGSSSSQFVVPVVVNYPLVVHPGDSLAVPIRFQPGSLGAKSGTILVTNNDPVVLIRMASVNGSVPPGDVRVTGSTDFGEVCAGALAEKTISVCNVGQCNLLVTNVAFSPGCADFILVNNPFPAVVSPDSCVDVVIRYAPTSCGAKTCALVIRTDDPDTPVVTLTVTASTPCGAIDVPPDLAFPPTVIQSFGPCRSQLPFPISNLGDCPLTITSITIGGPQGAEYSLVGLPSFPIILEAGHIVGEGDLSVAFAPTAVDRDREATLTVTYVVDPVSGATASVTRKLCGEGVQTGARVLVMQGGIPLAKVEKIQLQRINANRNKDPLDTHDVVQNALLVTVVPGAPCEPFQYHREYGTVSNPIQLLAGSYQVTVSAIINGKRKSRTVGFDVSTCDFNPTVVINY
jgi:hypothetical protein